MTGEFLRGDELNIHHKNHNRIDDRFDNLEKKGHAAHSIEHNADRRADVACECRTCGKAFNLPQHRLKEKGRGSYCSKDCYKAAPKIATRKRVTLSCVQCGSDFEVIRNRATSRKFCSNSCSALRRWSMPKTGGMTCAL